jgi:RNA polymerase sigma factor (sigma-70 family)
MIALAQNRYGFVAELYEQSKAAHLSSEDVRSLIVSYKKEKNEVKRDVLRDKIVATNVKLILKMANRAAKISRVPVADLFQNGVMGLLVALDKFKLNKNIKFSTYATPWVRKHIQLSMADSMDIRIIPQLKTNCRRYLDIKSEDSEAERIKAKVRHKKLGSVSSLEMASRVFFDQEAFASLQSQVRSSDGESATTLGAILADGKTIHVEADFERNILTQEVFEAVKRLKDREKQVILEKYFSDNGDDVSRNVISENMNMTNEGIRQIEIRAIENLRQMLSDK